jgi:hypothetical protein
MDELPDDLSEELTLRVTSKAAEAYRAMKVRNRRLSVAIVSRWLESEGRTIEEALPRLWDPPGAPDNWRVDIPIDPASRDGACVSGTVRWDLMELWYVDENAVGVMQSAFDLAMADYDKVAWADEAAYVFVSVNRAARLLRVLGPASKDDARKYRAPQWIQGSEVPSCCRMRMHFVGQIDDDDLCMERPPGAVLWWHDCASFYVFTCSICLGVKAVGQQC